MKIGIVHSLYQQRAGEEIIMESEHQFLEKAGVQSSLLLFNNGGSKWQQLINYIFAPFNPFAWRKISAWIEQEKPDIVHIHNWHFAASPSIICAVKRKGIPVIHTLHNFRLICPSGFLFHNKKLFLHSIKSSFPWRAILARVYNHSALQTFWLAITVWLHKMLGTWKSIDAYLVLTKNAEQLLLSSQLGLDKNQIIIKPNFSVDSPSRDQKKRGTHFLFVGRLSEEKGLLILLNAFRDKSMQLWIIGDGPLRPRVEVAERENDNIRYLGFQRKEVIMEEMKKSSALIVPSIWYEGFPLVILEAFACSTSVITSRLGAMESLIQEGINGLHFDPGSEKDLMTKLRLWQNLDESKQRQFRRNARISFEENYTPEKNTARLLSIYRSVLQKKMAMTKTHQRDLIPT